MGLFRPSRARRGPDPYYHWKVIVFSIGAAFGLGGIFTEHDWMILVAVPILAVGVALRWLPRPGEAGPDRPGDEGDEDDEDDEGEPPEIPPPT